MDIIFYGNSTYEDPRLIIPHPACWYRRFVLDPLTQIAADQLHPVKKCTVHELRERLLPRPLHIAICGREAEQRRELIAVLTERFDEVDFFEWTGEATSVARQPAIIAWLGRGDDGTLWEHLPPISRLGVTLLEGEPGQALSAVVQSALG